MISSEFMATEPRPPEDLLVPFNLRLPWKYKQQLTEKAEELRVSLHALCLDAITRRYPPK
jgi:predicted HicB family RNase H-like nuclease